MKITWRAVREEDLEKLKDWLNDPNTQKLARAIENVVFTEDMIRDDFMTKIEGRKVQIIEVDEEPVGWLKIWDHEENGREIGIVIGDPNFRSKGVGTSVLKRLVLILEPPLFWVTSSYNEGSVNLALKCDFALLSSFTDEITLDGKKYDKYIFIGGKKE